jgi:hypothetical protein
MQGLSGDRQSLEHAQGMRPSRGCGTAVVGLRSVPEGAARTRRSEPRAENPLVYAQCEFPIRPFVREIPEKRFRFR